MMVGSTGSAANIMPRVTAVIHTTPVTGKKGFRV